MVPIKRAQVNKLMAAYREEGTKLKGLQREWGQIGRDPLINSQGIKSIVDVLHSKPGHCLDKENVEAAIVERRKEVMIANGIQPLNDSAVAPCNSSIRNYQALLAAQPNVRIARTAIVKSHTCNTAENSLRSAMAFLLTTAAMVPILSYQMI